MSVLPVLASIKRSARETWHEVKAALDASVDPCPANVADLRQHHARQRRRIARDAFLNLSKGEAERRFAPLAERALNACQRSASFLNDEYTAYMAPRRSQEATNLIQRAGVMDRLERAIPLLLKAVEVSPDHVLAWSQLGACLSIVRRDEAAEAVCRKAIDVVEEANRRSSAQVCQYLEQTSAYGQVLDPNRLNTLLMSDPRTAFAAAEVMSANEAASQAYGVLASLLMKRGLVKESFGLFGPRATDAVTRGRGALRIERMWRGEPNRKVAVLAEDGLGDQMHLVRFVPRLRELGVEPVLYCDPPLARLFRQSLDGVTVRPWNGPAAFESWVGITSLPARLGATLEDLPPPPYLHAHSEWKGALPNGFRVGIKPNGDPKNYNDRARSIGASWTLTPPPGVSFINLEPDQTGARDFADTAALVAELDLVIAADNSMAHLAGAMGKPVWLLLSAVGTDGRWLQDRDDSPWYPSASLYRQTKANDWDSVLQRVRRDLAAAVLKASGRKDPASRRYLKTLPGALTPPARPQSQPAVHEAQNA